MAYVPWPLSGSTAVDRSPLNGLYAANTPLGGNPYQGMPYTPASWSPTGVEGQGLESHGSTPPHAPVQLPVFNPYGTYYSPQHAIAPEPFRGLDIASRTPMGDIIEYRGGFFSHNVEPIMPETVLHQMRQMEDLAWVQSGPKEKFPDSERGGLMKGLPPTADTRYVCISNCSHREMDEEMLDSTHLGKIKQDPEMMAVVGTRRLPGNRILLQFDHIDDAKRAFVHANQAATATGWKVDYVSPSAYHYSPGFQNTHSTTEEAHVVVTVASLAHRALADSKETKQECLMMVMAKAASDFGEGFVRRVIAHNFDEGQHRFRLEMSAISGTDKLVKAWNDGVSVYAPVATLAPAVLLRGFYWEHVQEPMSVFAPKQKGSLLDLSRRDNAQQGPSNGHRGPSNGHRGPHGNAALGQVRKNRQPRPLEFPDKVTGNNIAPWNIMSNREARTTVMLRNIPNKLGYFELRRIMESILHGRYDFLYMRVDFNNRCNVGYAFINFVEARDVLVFYHAVNDRTWTVFNTDKVAQVCYATIQGKDCLMERFRNSSVMTQWACMRARTFYSAIDRDQYNRPVNPRMYGLDSPFLPCNSKVKLYRSMQTAYQIGLYPPNSGGRRKGRNGRHGRDRGDPPRRGLAAYYGNPDTPPFTPMYGEFEGMTQDFGEFEGMTQDFDAFNMGGSPSSGVHGPRHRRH